MVVSAPGTFILFPVFHGGLISLPEHLLDYYFYFPSVIELKKVLGENNPPWEKQIKKKMTNGKDLGDTRRLINL